MIWALLGALGIGLSLGLMGSGGSIITVPVLTYLVGQSEKVAIAGSLGIVGCISLVASLPYALEKRVDFRSVWFFGVPGMAGAYLGALLSKFVSGGTQLCVFSGLMIVAGFFLLRPVVERPDAGEVRRSAFVIGAEGLVVGAVTGFVGVGGGFLIVPALVLLGGLPMHKAVGTSLWIIALKSFTGFVKYLDVLSDLELELDWGVVATFSMLGIAGSFAGKQVGSKLPQATLRRTFAFFLFAVGAFIVFKNWSHLTGGAGSTVAARS